MNSPPNLVSRKTSQPLGAPSSNNEISSDRLIQKLDLIPANKAQPDKLRHELFWGLSGLHKIRHQWLDISGEGTEDFLHNYAWYESLLQCVESEAERVFFLAYFRGASMVAIIPLKQCLYRVRKFGLAISMKLIVLYPFPNEAGRCDIICPEYIPELTLNRLLSDLGKQYRWSVFAFNQVKANSHLLLHTTVSDSCIRHVDHVMCYLDTDMSHEVFLQRYNSKFKRNLRRKWNKLATYGNIRLNVARGPDVALAFQQFVATENSGWKGDIDSSLASNQTTRTFYAYLLDRLSETDQATIYTLHVDDICIASHIAITTDSVMNVLRISYRQEYGSVSPGFLLFDRMLQDCCASDSIETLSFVTGRNWMEVWKAQQEPIYNYVYYRASLSGQFSRLLVYLYQYAEGKLKVKTCS